LLPPPASLEDGKTKSLYMVSELEKIKWPLRFEKLERIHKIIHSGKVILVPYEIDKLIPTGGNFVRQLNMNFLF